MPSPLDRDKREKGLSDMARRLGQDSQFIQSLSPQRPEPTLPLANTRALLDREDAMSGFPTTSLPPERLQFMKERGVTADVVSEPMADIDLENGFVLTPQGVIRKSAANSDPIAILDLRNGKVTALSGLQRLAQPNLQPGSDSPFDAPRKTKLLEALQQDVERKIGPITQPTPLGQVPSITDPFQLPVRPLNLPGSAMARKTAKPEGILKDTLDELAMGFSKIIPSVQSGIDVARIALASGDLVDAKLAQTIQELYAKEQRALSAPGLYLGGWGPSATDDIPYTGPPDPTVAKQLEKKNAAAQEKIKRLADNISQREAKDVKFLEQHPNLAPDPAFATPLTEDPSLILNPGYVLHWIAKSAGYSVTAVLGYGIGTLATGGSPIGGFAGAMMALTPITSSELYRSLILEGAAPEQAATVSVMLGPVLAGLEGATEVLGLSKLAPGAMKTLEKGFAREVGQYVARKAVLRFGKAFTAIQAGEIVTELSQNTLENLARKAFNADIGALDNWQTTISQTFVTTLGMGALGGAANVAVGGAVPTTQQLREAMDKILEDERGSVGGPSEPVGKPLEYQAEKFSAGLDAGSVFEGGEVKPGMGYSWRSMGPKEFDQITSKGTVLGAAQRGRYWSWFPGYSSKLEGKVGSPKYLVEVSVPSEGETLTRAAKPEDITGLWRSEGKGWAKIELPEQPTAAPAIRQVPGEPEAKQTWQIGAVEYRRYKRSLLTSEQQQKWAEPERVSGSKVNVEQQWDAEHRTIIQNALLEGKPVPTEVLADYPDLQAKVPRQVPFEPEAGVQAGAFGVSDKDVRPVGKGKATQIGMDDQLRLERLRAEAEATQPEAELTQVEPTPTEPEIPEDTEREIYELEEQAAGLEETLKDNWLANLVIKYQTTPSKISPKKGRKREFKPTREVSIFSIVDSTGHVPLTFTGKTASAMLGGKVLSPGAFISKDAFTKTKRVPRNVAFEAIIADLAEFQPGVERTADDVADMIERLFADKNKIEELRDRAFSLEQDAIAAAEAAEDAAWAAAASEATVAVVRTAAETVPTPAVTAPQPVIEGIAKAEVGVSAEDAAVAEVNPNLPPVPPKPPRDFTKWADGQFDRFRQTAPDPLPSTRLATGQVRAIGKAIEKQTTDMFARLNALGWQAEVFAALTRGSPGKAQELYRETFNKIRTTLGGNGNLIEYVVDYLILRHQLEVMKATGRPVFKMNKGGKTNTYSPKQIQAIFASMKRRLGPTDYVKVKTAASAVPSVYHAILQETQELTREQIRGLIRKYPWYNPILFEDGSSKAASVIDISGKLTPRQIKRLSELSSSKEIISPLDALAGTIQRRVTANDINTAKISIAELAVANLKIAGGEVTIIPAGVIPKQAHFDFFQDGKRKFAVLGPGAEWIAEDIKLLTVQPSNVVNRFVRAIQRISKDAFTTYNPGFVAYNTLFDGLTAFFTEGIGPFGYTKGLAKTVKSIFAEDETLNALRTAGGDVTGFFGDKEGIESVVRRSKKGVITLRNPKDLKRFINPFQIIKALGHAGENAARVAVYQKAIKEGLSPSEAALRGRRVTVDFQRAGQAAKVVNDWYIFFNAGLQGFMLPGRTLAHNPKARARLAVLLTGYVGLTFYNQSYDEYDDVPTGEKQNFLLIMLPSTEYNSKGQKVPHRIRVMPLREFSLFTAPVEYAMGKMRTDSPESYRTLGQAFGAWHPAWSPFSMFTEAGGMTFPTQVGSTIQQVMANHDTFRDRPIVDDEMKLLPATEQYDQYTDSVAIKLGQAFGISPKVLDFAVGNLFGSLGSDALRGLDLIVQQIDRELVDERIAGLVEKLRAIPTNVPPGQIQVARETFLEGLPVEDRDIVLSMERLPAEKIPVIDSFWERFYKTYGGQVERDVREKIQQGRTAADLPPEPLKKLQDDALKNTENLMSGKITKEQFDKQDAYYRPYYSGGSTADWREAMTEGAVSRAELDKSLPEAYRRSEEFQAVSALQEIRSELIEKAGGVLDSTTWQRIEFESQAELEKHYSDTAVQYALDHKDDWIDKLPEPARGLYRARARAMETGTWWDNYRGATSSKTSGLGSGQTQQPLRESKAGQGPLRAPKAVQEPLSRR
uniref:Large polyvalent protein associated domain-containing protein n=1 Tax=viral metagenome TaxID=1070528 RepID=A0A6M3IR09_9ZZZZ